MTLNSTTSPIHITNNFLMPVNHISTVFLPSLFIYDIYFVPCISFNLLFVGQLVDMYYDVLFNKRGFVVMNFQTRQVARIGCKVSHMFKLTLMPLPKIIAPTLCVAFTSSFLDSSLDLQYRFLAHPSLSKLHLLILSGFLNHIHNQSLQCIYCQIAKQPALLFYKNDSIAVSPFDLIYFDI